MSRRTKQAPSCGHQCSAASSRIPTRTIFQCAGSLYLQRSKVLRDESSCSGVREANQGPTYLVLCARRAVAPRRSRSATAEEGREAVLLASEARPRDRAHSQHLPSGGRDANSIDRERGPEQAALSRSEGCHSWMDDGSWLHSAGSGRRVLSGDVAARHLRTIRRGMVFVIFSE